MTLLVITNIGDVSDDEVKAFLVRYGFPTFDAIERIPGDGSMAEAAVLTFAGVDPIVLRSLQPRVNHLFWKDRSITVQVMMSHPE
jgi:hypothetical protein